jgi:N-acetylglutamate synthase-like GNAT family acetyltransferase
MKTDSLGVIADRSITHRHHSKNYSVMRPKDPRDHSRDRRNPHFGNTNIRSRHVCDENNSINSAWIIRIGNRVVGMARLEQDGPQSVRIALFRIDPEWSHTHVPMNLIRSIQIHCKQHGHLKVFLPPHIVPPWMVALMNQHGFQCAAN